jgi:hypothetical protein
MKSSLTVVLTTILFLVCSPLQAQITMTMADVSNWYAVGKGQRQLQKSNDSLLYSMNAGVTSPTLSQTWTLPTVQYTDTMLIKNVVPSSTLYVSKFPSATHAQMIEITSSGTFVGMYLYLRIANDSLKVLGGVIRQKYGTVDTTDFNAASPSLIKLPLALGGVLPSVRDSQYYGPGNYQISTKTETFDAFGTTTLPNGTFSCLRSRETSFYTKFTPGRVDTFTIIRFHWMTKEGHQGSVSAWKKDSTSGSIRVQEVRSTAIVTVPTAVDQHQISAPTSFALLQNYPNPFNPSTAISYQLAANSSVKLSVIDLLGREIGVLVNENRPAGIHNAVWNADRYPSGLYLYRLEAVSSEDPNKSFVQVRKMLMIK